MNHPKNTDNRWGISLLVFGGFLVLSILTWSFQQEGLVTEVPSMDIPQDNALSKERIALGRQLFYDPILSVDSTISCASCHKQSLAFADNAAVSAGVGNRLGNRNAPTLTNVGYNPNYLFDGFLETLEKQAIVPIEEHAEMAFNMVEAAKRLKRSNHYVKAAAKAYGRKPDPFVITRALASFQRTLVSTNSRYDQFLNGKVRLTEQEELGKQLFFNRLHCSTCHGGFNFTNFSTQNNGMFPIYLDSGRMRVTHLESDRDRFKVPTLRNIALTRPYMHNGSIQTLREVIRIYAKGGFPNKNKHAIIQPFSITEEEEDALIAFLNTLTDRRFIRDKRFSNPFN
jgi:cytochrome c peroxidase